MILWIIIILLCFCLSIDKIRSSIFSFLYQADMFIVRWILALGFGLLILFVVISMAKYPYNYNFNEEKETLLLFDQHRDVVAQNILAPYDVVNEDSYNQYSTDIFIIAENFTGISVDDAIIMRMLNNQLRRIYDDVNDNVRYYNKAADDLFGIYFWVDKIEFSNTELDNKYN